MRLFVAIILKTLIYFGLSIPYFSFISSIYLSWTKGVDERLINYLPIQDAYLTNEKIALGNFLIFLILFIVPVLIHVAAKLPNILLKVRGNTSLDLFTLLVLGIVSAVFINFYVYQAKTYQFANINIVLTILIVFILMQLLFSYFIVFVILGIIRKKQVEHLEELLTHDMQAEPKEKRTLFSFLKRKKTNKILEPEAIGVKEPKTRINIKYHFSKLVSKLNKKKYGAELKSK